MPRQSRNATIGETRTTVPALLRRGAPSTTSPRAARLAAGTRVAVRATVPGEVVAGNARWYVTDAGLYLWSGACAPLLPMVPPVVDLYHGNRVTNFADAHAAGVRGVIHKASTGATGRDPAYAERRAAARAAGLLWGAYHWGNARPVADQVENFLAAARPDEATLVALDYERDPGNQMTLAGARDFLALLGEKLGRRPVLYSGHLIKDQLGDRVDAFFGSHRLWLAHYAAAPVVQASWASWWLWQYADGPAQVPGIPGDAAGHVDRNQFAGTAEQLAADWAA